MIRRSGQTFRRAAFAVAAVIAAAALSACQEVEAQERVFKSESKLTAAEGEEGHALVTLTQKGINQIGLETAVVGGTKDEMVIPYTALLYAADGEHAYVYANPEGRSYQREDVKVIRVDGDRVLISDGPPVGTKVVTQGVAQVHGAELEFGKY
ncbi:MAG: hypothetical protein M3Q98_01490 [Actinomycetota bacterium]|nr:hypothetical protein [Actinomycetota bacterium]